MPKTKTYGIIRDAEHIISEAEGRRSREQIVIDATSFTGDDAIALQPGRVLGRVSATGRFKPHDIGASDGTQTVATVLYARVEAKGASHVRAVGHSRDCEVNGYKLFWKAGISAPNKATSETALGALGVIVRY